MHVVPLVPILSCVLLAGGDADPEPLDPKEALESVLHGSCRLKRDRLEVGYDFGEKEQVKDFATTGIFDFGGLLGRETEPPGWEKGKLILRASSGVEWGVRVSRIDTVSVVMSGVDDIRLSLTGGKESLRAELGEFTNLYVGSESILEFDFTKIKSLNLMKSKRYRVDLILNRRKVTVKLDGRAVLAGDLPKDFPDLDRLQISTRSAGQPALEQLRIQSRLRPERLLAAINSGRANRGEPPYWPESREVVGEHTRLATDADAETMKRWQEVVETVIRTYLADFPETSRPEQIPVYLFTDKDLFEAYAKSGHSRLLESGGIAYLEGDAKSGTPLQRAGDLVAAALLRPLGKNVPHWWEMGITAYYGGVETIANTVKVGCLRPAYVAHAQKQLESETGVTVRDFPGLKEKDGWQAVTLAWAWVYFLRHAEEGAHAKHLLEFDRGLRAGQGPRGLFSDVFPKETFADLREKFAVWLEAQ